MLGKYYFTQDSSKKIREVKMRKLFVYLKEYKKESVFAPLFKMLEAIFELFVPLVMATMIDKGMIPKDMTTVLKMGGVLILLAVVGLSASVTAQFFAAKAATGFGTKLRHALFKHIQSLSFAEMDTIGNNTLITRMTSDINQVQSGVNMTLRLFLRSPFIVFGAMIMAFTVDVKAALVFAVAIPLLSIVVFGIMLINMPLYKKVQGALDNVLGKTRENLTGARVIRAFNMEKEEIADFEEKNELLTNMQKLVGRIAGLTNPITYIIVNGALVVIIWVGALRVDSGILTQGMVVALVNYMLQILVELIKLANLIVTMTKAAASGNRIQGVFEMTSSLKDGTLEGSKETAPNIPIVTFDHVSFTYAGSSEKALEDIHFSVAKGEVIGIIGGTGSGKSSIVNLIPRDYDASEGQVSILGTNVIDYKMKDLRQRVGMVMQKAVLFKGTVRENLKWGNKEATDEELWEALAIAQADGFIKEKEGGLDFVIEQGGKNLSGGQKQRLTIARALVRKPDILILDDSASALDFATDAALRKAIQEMKQKPTVFIVSQRAASMMHASQILVLEDGKMVGHGTHETLLKDCEVYQEIYYSQYGKEVRAHE